MAVVAEELISDLIVRDDKLRSGVRSAQQAYGAGVGAMRDDTKRFEAGVATAGRNIDTGFRRIETSGSRMGRGVSNSFNLAKGAAIGFVASLGVEGVIRAIGAGLNYASSLGEVASQLGVTSDALQEYRYAASQAGLSTEEIDQALSQLTRRIGEGVNGTKAQAEAFEKLGISLRDAKGNVITTGDAIPRIAEALKQVESPAQRAAILMDLFGRSGQKLEALLAGGAAGVNELRDAAHKLGIVLSEEQINKADETADKLSALKQVLEAKIAGAAADNADAILEIANALVKLTEAIGKAAKAWRYFTSLDFSWDAPSLGAQLNAMQVRDLGPGVELTDSVKRAVAQRRNAAISAPSGGNLLRVPPKSSAPAAPTSAFGRPINTNLNVRRAAGGNAFGASDYSQFTPGTGAMGILAAAIIGPTKEQAAVIKAATLEIQRQAADLSAVEAELSGSLDKRVAAEKARIDVDARAEAERIKANDDIKGAERDELLALNERTALARKQLVDQRASEEIAQSRRDAQRENLALEMAALEAEGDVAQSARGRAVIEARLLELQQQEERERLETLIAAGSVADATAARAALGRKQSADQEGVRLGARGPLERYRDESNKTAEEIQEDIENIQVQGLNSLGDGITDVIMQTRSLGDVFKSVANQIIADLIRIAVQKFIVNTLFGVASSALGGGNPLGSGGGSKIANIVKGGRAGGGPVRAGQLYRVNEGQQEFFRPATDGRVVPLSQQAQAARPAGGASAGPTIVQLAVAPGEMFVPIVEGISGNVAVRTVQATAPGIVRAATIETTRRAMRPRT